MLKMNEGRAPLRRNIDLDDVGRAAVFLMSDLASAVTGEIVHVDAGFSITGI
jgi:enoyl-[acyl-carrier protein] reductase I